MDELVLKFVERNKVPVKEGFICVDGRYSAPKYAGMLARPGGNFRGILVLLALRKKLEVTVGRIVDLIVEATESRGDKFRMHTDKADHNPLDLGDIGCGHIAKAEDPKLALMYQVDPLDVSHAVTYLRIKLEGQTDFEIQELDGVHKEKGILVITGTKYTVNHWDRERGEMFFVFDKARDDEYLKTHFEPVHKRFPQITFEQYKEISDLQLNATLHNLASGLPIYEVNLDQEIPEIKFVGNVS